MEKEQEQQQEHDAENEDALFVFGYGLTGHFPASLRRGADRDGRGSRSIDVKKVSTPVCALRARGIQVVWASWCDAICMYVFLNVWSHVYVLFVCTVEQCLVISRLIPCLDRHVYRTLYSALQFIISKTRHRGSLHIHEIV